MIKSIPLGGAPEQAYADGKGMIYDTLQSTNEIVAIDANDLTVKSRWPVAPSGAARFDRDGPQDPAAVSSAAEIPRCW